MLSAERERRLMTMLRQEPTLSVTGAAQRLGVSHSTIRRDFDNLERLGVVSRVHGGVVVAGAAPPVLEAPRLARSSEHAEEKRRIGETAARLIDESETVFISGGTTTDAMLPALGRFRRLTIVTNNMQTALGAAQHPTLDVVVLGGYLRRDEMSLLGYLAAQAIKHLTIDRAFFSAYAVGPLGLMGAEMDETETDRALIGSAHQLVVLADHSKFQRTAPARLATVSAIHTLVTDFGVPEEIRTALTRQGVNVVTC